MFDNTIIDVVFWSDNVLLESLITNIEIFCFTEFSNLKEITALIHMFKITIKIAVPIRRVVHPYHKSDTKL